MTYAHSFIKVTLGFTVVSTDEIAQTSLHFGSTGAYDAVSGLSEIYSSGHLGTIASDYVTHVAGSSGLKWGVYSRLSSVKAAAIGSSGHYLVDPVILSSAYGAGSDNLVPPQCSMVATLWSGQTLGRANYGRLYLPHTQGSNTATSPYVNTATCGNIADGVKAWLDLANGYFDGLSHPAALINLSAVGVGLNKAVTQVRIGNVVDTQRRRRNRLKEVYSSAALA